MARRISAAQLLPGADDTLAPDFQLKGAPMREEISAVLLHQPAESQRLLKQALEGRSIKVNWLQNCREALPLLREADPPHLVFTDRKSVV